NYVQIGLVTAWLCTTINMYRSEYSVLNYLAFERHPVRIAKFWSLTFVGLITLAFVTKTTDVHSRGWLILFFFPGFPTLMVVHGLLVRAMMAGGEVGLVATKRLFLVGTAPEIRDFIRRCQVRELGLEIAGAAHLHRPTGLWTAKSEARFSDD